MNELIHKRRDLVGALDILETEMKQEYVRPKQVNDCMDRVTTCFTTHLFVNYELLKVSRIKEEVGLMVPRGRKLINLAYPSQ